MAFDQNTIPKDLRPINISRTIAEEPHISPLTAAVRNVEGVFPNTARDIASSSPLSVFYPVSVTDTGFVGVGYGNAAHGVPSRCLPVQLPVGPTGMSPTVGFGYNPNMGIWVGGGNAVGQATNELLAGYGYSPNSGSRISSNAAEIASNDSETGFFCSSNLNTRADQVSDDGGDDSTSGKKVKLLCSYGGKILPRPSDGMLRYVGGQTRIISIRRDVNFNELVQKMSDIYGQPMAIKYQLPDEDLDALVSVSCSDDLDNMMDEYAKLVERSPDGLAKLRVFLFSASDLDSPTAVKVGDLHDSGQRYVEAVNGLLDGSGGGVTRKESIASVTSTQNSDYSGNEVVDSLVVYQGDVSGPPSTSTLSPRGDTVTLNDNALKLACVDPSPSGYTDASAISMGMPVVKPVPSQTSSQLELESARSSSFTVPQQQLGIELQQPAGEIQPSTPYLQTYIDPRQEVISHAGYVQLPPQMGFPNPQLLSATGSVFTPQQFCDNATGASTHQYIPTMHMTMTPTPSQAGSRPNVVQPLMQVQQTRFDPYPDESAFGPRVVQFPVNYNAYQPQGPSNLVGGSYGWHHVPPPEHVVFTDWMVPQQVMYPEKIPRLEDCFLCQKALPHAHSDTVLQGNKENDASSASDTNSVYHNLCPEDVTRSQPISRVMVAGSLGEGLVEQEAGSHSGVLGHMDKVGMHSETYGAFTGHDNSVQQHPRSPQYQIKQDILANKPITGDSSSGKAAPPRGSCMFQESPIEYSGVLQGIVPLEDASVNVPRPIDGRMGILRIQSPETFMYNEQSNSPVNELKKEDIFNQMQQQTAGKEGILDNVFCKPNIPPDTSYIQSTEVATSTGVPYLQKFQPVDAYEVTQSPLMGNPGGPSRFGSEDILYGNPAFLDKIQPVGEWKDDTSGFQPQMVPSDFEVTSLSPCVGTGDVQHSSNSSNSLFSNQDPWNMRQDIHFLPNSNRSPTNLGALGAQEFCSENYLVNIGELNSGILSDGVHQKFSNANNDSSSEHGHSGKGSAEELVKQELKAVAEGVAASVLQSSLPLDSDLSLHETDESTYIVSQDGGVPNSSSEIQYTAKTEENKKVNFGFPVSDGIGRLQIIKNSDLEELRELGSGTFGTVYHGKWRGTDVAIKRINDRCFAGKASEQERMRDDFWNEAIKLADLHHPNVVAFYGVVLDGPGGSVATVTEYMVNGSLRNSLQKSERVPDKRKRLLIAMDVAFGMEYLHGKNIVHFDLKSDNLLVNLRDPHRPICKVGDLGLSKVKCQTLISGGVRGTLPWMAPELLNGSSSLVSEKVDVFSFGIVLWELLTGEEPYADLHYGAIIGGIVSNTLRPPVPVSCDQDWKSLMERCWASEPSERPNFTEIVNELRRTASKIPSKG